MVTQHHLPLLTVPACFSDKAMWKDSKLLGLSFPSSKKGMPVLSQGLGPGAASFPPQRPGVYLLPSPPTAPVGSSLAPGDVTARQATNLHRGKKARDHPGWGDPTHWLIPSSSLIILLVVVTFI